MKLLAVSVGLSALAVVFAGPLEISLERRAVSQDVYDNLYHFVLYASAAYQPTCPRPLGNTLVATLNDPVTDTQGFIARDDNRKEIVVVLRGSQQPEDFFTDFNFELSPYMSPGVTGTAGALAHTGFQLAYNSVADQIISTVRTQTSAYPDYSLVSSGHSLGGALSSLAGISLKSNFPDSNVTMYTYGQPRTGNARYASLAENRLGADKIFRSVHTTDGIPTVIPTFIGYRHHATEYWQTPDPASPATVKKCNGGEDPTCSASVPSMPFNPAHGVYYNVDIGSDPTLCA